MFVSRNRELISVGGFTLAELLIALLILGVISAFTIPKILANQQNQEKKAVMRETIAALSEVIYTGKMKGEITTSNAFQYVLDHVNALKLCPTNSLTEGCAVAAMYQETTPGFTLPNGAWVSVNSAVETDVKRMHIDWNGSDGPNAWGPTGDTIHVLGGITNTTYANGRGPVRPGTVVAWDDSSSNWDFWESIFNN